MFIAYIVATTWLWLGLGLTLVNPILAPQPLNQKQFQCIRVSDVTEIKLRVHISDIRN